MNQTIGNKSLRLIQNISTSARLHSLMLAEESQGAISNTVLPCKLHRQTTATTDQTAV